MSLSPAQWRSIGVAACALLLALPAPAQQDERSAFRVCQDPNNLPFSNVKGEGIENKIAELFATQLKLPVEYFSFPQRLGFIRNTLRYRLPGDDYRCDIVMGVPAAFDQVSPTKPYYRSTYALVYPQGKGLDAIASGADLITYLQTNKLRIGLFDKSPASEWLTKYGLIDAAVVYPILNPDPDQYPGELIEKELASGKIDAAIVWGPIAGFFAKRVKSPVLNVVALKSERGVKFDYEIAMGVRHGEAAWKQQIEQLIDANQAAIKEILTDFYVPLVDERAAAPR